jgi:PilZ domain-containing protein
VERRKFPRQDVRGTPIRATLVLTGGSLLNKDSLNAVEIETHPIDLSRGGMSVLLGLDSVWATLSPEREVELHINRTGEPQSRIRARVVRVEAGDHVLGLEFEAPLETASPLLTLQLH